MTELLTPPEVQGRKHKKQLFTVRTLLSSDLKIQSKPVLTMPMHFFRILQMLTSFLENMGAGRHDLWEGEEQTTVKGKNIGLVYTSCTRNTQLHSILQFPNHYKEITTSYTDYLLFQHETENNTFKGLFCPLRVEIFVLSQSCRADDVAWSTIGDQSHLTPVS